MKILLFIFLLFGLGTSLSAQHHHTRGDGVNAIKITAGHSLYHLDGEWTDHRGNTYTLSDFAGAPVIVVLFYGNCTQVCPILIRDARRLYSMLDEDAKHAVHVLAITFDTESDTPEVLRAYAENEKLNIAGWHFMTSKAASVRSLAMMLGVQYMKRSDGHFAHSNLVTVLDKQGRIAERVEGLNQPMDEAALKISTINEADIQQ